MLAPSLALALTTHAAACTHPTYGEAVELYRAGQLVEAIEAMEALREPPDSGKETEPACAMTLALLDTELGMAHAASSRWTAARAYFDAAWRSSGQIEDVPRRKRFQRDWLLTVGLFYQGLIFSVDPTACFRAAEHYLDEALEIDPDDPVLLLAAGALAEWASSAKLLGSEGAERAEKLYSRAVRADPRNAEANVRLGWVRIHGLNAPDEAVSPLALGVELASDAILIYRGRMGLGRVAEHSGRLDEAADHYRAAIRVEPGWQVGHIALGNVLRRNGSRAASRETLASAVEIPDSDANLFGWWSYELGLSPRAEPLLLRLRDEVMR